MHHSSPAGASGSTAVIRLSNGTGELAREVLQQPVWLDDRPFDRGGLAGQFPRVGEPRVSCIMTVGDARGAGVNSGSTV